MTEVCIAVAAGCCSTACWFDDGCCCFCCGCSGDSKSSEDVEDKDDDDDSDGCWGSNSSSRTNSNRSASDTTATASRSRSQAAAYVATMFEQARSVADAPRSGGCTVSASSRSPAAVVVAAEVPSADATDEDATPAVVTAGESSRYRMRST